MNEIFNDNWDEITLNEKNVDGVKCFGVRIKT